jgi:hypothetical protein
MRRHRHFGLGLSKTPGPMLEVNSDKPDAALQLRFQPLGAKQISCVKSMRIAKSHARHREHLIVPADS